MLQQNDDGIWGQNIWTQVLTLTFSDWAPHWVIQFPDYKEKIISTSQDYSEIYMQ